MKLVSGTFLRAAAVFCAIGAAPVFAATVTNQLGTLGSATVLTGTLADGGSVQLEDFTLSSASALTIYSTSYAGGSNLDGTMTAAGGFQPNIGLFDTTGFAIAQSTGSYPGNAGDPATGIVGDTYFMTPSLMAGNYVLAISNFWVSGDPVSGFVNIGDGSLSDAGGNVRTGNFSVNLAQGSMAQTPEPASIWLTFPVALGMFGMWRKRKSSARN